MDYGISDHMLVVCKIKFEKPENEFCHLKFLQDLNKFEVGVFLNNLSVKLRNMILCAENCGNVEMNLRVFLV